jgi:ACT domain-containing protein
LAITAVKAQSPADRIFDKYSGKEGYTTVFISKYMFDLFSNIEPTDPEAKEMKEAISKLTGIKILASEKPDESVSFLKEMKKDISSGGYKELMVIKEGDQDVQFLVHEDNGKVSELLLIVSDKGENVLISIQGDIDMKNISKLANVMDIEGMDKLENIDK